MAGSGTDRAVAAPSGLGRRIAVLGCGGAGKSRLAREIGRRLALPVIHLDAEYWKPGWVETPDAEWEAQQEGMFAGEAWVADGNFHRTLRWRAARAETILFLDLPRRTCLRGIFGRWLRHRGEVREDMAPGCPEGFDWDFLKWVWTFRKNVRPRVLEMLAEYESRGGRVVVLRSRREVDRFLERVF